MKKWILIVLFLVLVACGRNTEQPITEEPHAQPVEEQPTEEQANEEQPQEEAGTEEPSTEEPNDKTVQLSNFFMKDGAIAHFLGEGNEFAEFTQKTQWLTDRYVNVYENNGGTVMLRTFRLDDDQIVVLQEIPEQYEEVTYTEQELDAMEPIYTYLQFPLEVDSSFEGWTVIDDHATLDTPLQTFFDVTIIEHVDENGAINRKYFAKGFGEIKREFIMHDGDIVFTVSSTIEKVE